MSTDIYDREPTEHEQAGMAWWNAMSKEERTLWLYLVGGKASPADAYELYLKRQPSGDAQQ